MTNLGSLNSAIPYGIASLHAAYKKRMEIKESYLDYKSGGDYLEGTGLKGKRLMTLILLIALAYSNAVMEGKTLKMKAVKKYIIRPKQSKIKYQSRSTFASGLDSKQWVTYKDKYTGAVQ